MQYVQWNSPGHTFNRYDADASADHMTSLPMHDFYVKNPTGAKLDVKNNVLNPTFINLYSNLFDCIPFQR
ncbi:MAG: hypothetical protein DID92_2727744908 [Candidatus Nitrotoga sp. SPKER]|nr:MAG: hypothetical protein DID92_2727744908 [Candidatus Nitrotoga sp. SPKER]